MQNLDDLMDRLVAEYADRLARGQTGEPDDLLARLPEDQRPNLARCLRMMRAGIAAAPAAGAVLGPGVRLGEFQIVRELGRGGMAVVYLARQTELEREVALKVLRPGLAIEGRHVDRFKREALAVARLKHPHIVQVYAVGEDKGYHFLAMELVEGRSLAAVLDELPPIRTRTAADLERLTGMKAPPDATYEQALCALLAPVARALGTAHEVGIVHRDVKPSNILIHADGRAVIADFGLAKSDGDPGLSLSGEPLGTPFYMSPEQAALTEHGVDQRTDVYSLGVTLYEALAGERPFGGETVLAVLDAVRNRLPEPLRARNPAATQDATAVARRAMEKTPDGRYPSALELAVDMSSLAQGLTTQALVREGGPLRRTLRGFQAYWRGEVPEYRSSTTLLGWPLVHLVSGRRAPGQKLRVAKGWIAGGPVAVGLIASGGMAFGGLTWGGVSVGLGAFGGIAAGILPFGGISLGYVALGGVAVGWGAIGGLAIGRYAMGGKPIAPFAVGPESQAQEALAFFEPLAPFLRWIPGFGWL